MTRTGCAGAFRRFAVLVFCLPVLCCCGADNPEADDRLSLLSNQVDQLEKQYWRALAMPRENEYYQRTQKLLRDVETSARNLQRAVEKSRREELREYNVTIPVNTLQNIFQNIAYRQATQYRYTFRYTSMNEYESEHNRTAARTGKKREFPTLTNIDIDTYELWLIDVCNDNTTKFSWARGKRKSDSTTELMSEYISQYMTALRQLRVYMAHLRQSGKGVNFK